MSHRERLLEFLQQYGPSHAANVDAILLNLEMNCHAQILELIRVTAGLDPTVPSTDAPCTTPQEYRERIVAFTRQYLPEKESSLDVVIEGRYQQVYEDYRRAIQSCSAIGHREELETYLRQNHPGQLDFVDGILYQLELDCREDTLSHLCRKYGPEPGGLGRPLTRTHESTPEEYHERLLATMRRYRPENLSNLDVAVERGFRSGFEAFRKDPTKIFAKVNETKTMPNWNIPTFSAASVEETTVNNSNNGNHEACVNDDRTIVPHHKEHVLAYLMRSDRDLVQSVDAITLQLEVESYEYLIQSFRSQYGPEPSSDFPHAVSHAGYRQRILNILHRYNPPFIKDINFMVESSFNRKLKEYENKRYNERAYTDGRRALPPDLLPSLFEEDPEGAHLQERIYGMFYQYIAEKVDTIDFVMSKYDGQEEKMLRLLVDKYGPEPIPDAALLEQIHSIVLRNEPGYADRVVANARFNVGRERAILDALTAADWPTLRIERAQRPPRRAPTHVSGIDLTPGKNKPKKECILS